MAYTAKRSTSRFHGACRIAAFVLAVGLHLLTGSVQADQLVELAKKAGIAVTADGESSSDRLKESRTTLPLNLLTAKNRQRAAQLLDVCDDFGGAGGLPFLQRHAARG